MLNATTDYNPLAQYLIIAGSHNTTPSVLSTIDNMFENYFCPLHCSLTSRLLRVQTCVFVETGWPNSQRWRGWYINILRGYLEWISVYLEISLCSPPLIRLRGLGGRCCRCWINMSAQTRAITPISAHHSLTTLSSALG